MTPAVPAAAPAVRPLGDIAAVAKFFIPSSYPPENIVLRDSPAVKSVGTGGATGGVTGPVIVPTPPVAPCPIASVAPVVAASTPGVTPAAAPSNALVPNPAVSPDNNALEPEPPVCAYVAKPAPIPAAAALLNPAVAKPPNVLPVKKVVPSIEPKIGAKKGKNASGCPVSGFVVRGTCDANPLTSAGFT